MKILLRLIFDTYIIKVSFLELCLSWHSVPLGTQSPLALSLSWHSVPLGTQSHLALSLSWHSVPLGTRSPWHSVPLGTRSPWHSVSLALSLLALSLLGTRSLGTRLQDLIICRESCFSVFFNKLKSTNGYLLNTSLNKTKSWSLSIVFSIFHWITLYLTFTLPYFGSYLGTWVVFLSVSNGCLPFVVFSSGRTLFSNIYIRSPNLNFVCGATFPRSNSVSFTIISMLPRISGGTS